MVEDGGSTSFLAPAGLHGSGLARPSGLHGSGLAELRPEWSTGRERPDSTAPSGLHHTPPLPAGSTFVDGETSTDDSSSFLDSPDDGGSASFLDTEDTVHSSRSRKGVFLAQLGGLLAAQGAAQGVLAQGAQQIQEGTIASLEQGNGRSPTPSPSEAEGSVGDLPEGNKEAESAPTPSEAEEKAPTPSEAEEKAPTPSEAEEKTPTPSEAEEKAPAPSEAEGKEPKPISDAERKAEKEGEAPSSGVLRRPRFLIVGSDQMITRSVPASGPPILLR